MGRGVSWFGCWWCCEFILELGKHGRGGAVDVVRRSKVRGWRLRGLVQLGWLIAVRVGLAGAVDGEWFGTESGEACTCIVGGGAGEGLWGA